METVTIPGVELVRVGTWHGSMDGKPSAVTITAEDLADAVAAASDRNVDAAPLKVGHASPALGDGAPALGWLANVRTSADGTRLVADLTDVPAKFAKLLPKAFRRRSAELAYGLRTPTGKRYRLVVTALSVLGVTPPAVKGLADIESLYGLGSPSLEADHRGATLAAGDLDPAAVEKLATALDALDALDLDEATRVRLAADLEAAAGVTDATIPPPSNVSGQTGADATNRPDEEAPAVPITDEKLRELIGAAEDADLEQAIADLKAKADKAPASSDGTPPAGDGTGDGTGDGANAGELVGAGALSATTVAELKAAGVSIVTDELLEELRAPAVQLAEASRAAILDKAIAEGRISPAERGGPSTDGKPATGFYALLAADEAATVALLGSMAPRYAVAELGAAHAADATDDAAFAEFEASFLDTPAGTAAD